jgi:TatD DNase family protein
MIFDTHAHYDDKRFDDDREVLLKTMKDNGVGLITNVGSTVKTWDKILDLTQRYSFVYGTIGIHPSITEELTDENLEGLKTYLDKEKIVAVGEIGLDYYWDKEHHQLQKEMFIKQLEIAREYKLPAVIHSREAAADTYEIINQYAKELTCMLHCFSYSKEQAIEYVKKGHYIGICGVVTFNNGKKLKEVVKEVPLTSILLETDAPYLSPEPKRGKRNDSTNLIYVAQAIAEIKGITVDEVIKQTYNNGRKFFALL